MKIIQDLVYLTHDKWGDNEIKYREQFVDYLTQFITKHPEVVEDLNYIVEYGQTDKGLVIMRGVMQYLYDRYPQTHKEIILSHRIKWDRGIFKKDD